jgi:hypothetical protein
MKKLIVLFVVIFAFFNCKNKSEDTNKITEPIEIIENDISEALLEIGCYAYNANKSSVTFEITDIEDSIITGTLNYHLAEKDANIGTFKGVLLDDIILGDYIFQSEGLTSKREVIFKLINGQLIEGYGDMDEEGICFANTDHVTFTSTMPLTKTDCNK